MAAALLLIAGLSIGTLTPAAQHHHHKSSYTVLCDKYLRISILAEGIFRVERDATGSGRFEDRGSLAFRRDPPADTLPTFDVSNSSAACSVVFPGITITYNKTSPSFDLAVTVAGRGEIWRSTTATPASTAADQLSGGTIYQLTGVNGTRCGLNNVGVACDSVGNIDLKCGGTTTTSNQFCTRGVLTKSGIAVFSDENNTVIDPTTGWWAPSVHLGNAGDRDLYFFVSTDNSAVDRHRNALRALASVSGKAAVPPRRFFGVWWSRWDKYSETELRALIRDFEENGIPVDGINLDTEWHRNQKGYLDGSKVNWYSGLFDWDKSLYEDPDRMIDWLTDRGLWPVWHDIHQNSGVLPDNSEFPTFAQKLGLENRSAAVACEVGDKAYMGAFFELLAKQTGGRNLWWLDNSAKNGILNARNETGLNPVLWDRLQFFVNAYNTTKVGRRSVMGPYGGLGTHRAPFVHSGDTVTSWETLQYLPKFTATASHVLISYMSHDMGGHRDYGNGNNVELYVRSVQYGAWTAQMRPHAAKTVLKSKCVQPPCDSRFDRRYWSFPYDDFSIMRASLRLRARLVPYSYTMALSSWLLTGGVPFLRHIYVDFPDDPAATNAAELGHYLYGDTFLVAPVVRQMDPSTNLTKHLVSLPKLGPETTATSSTGGKSSSGARWVEMGSGRCFQGSSATPMALYYTLSETAVFVKGGSIIPMAPPPTRKLPRVDWEGGPPGDVSSCAKLQDELLLVGGAARAPCTLHWHVYLGNATAGSGFVLEDDGFSELDWDSPEYSRIDAKYTLSSDNLGMTFTIGAATGPGYKDHVSGAEQPSARPMVVEIHNVLKPIDVTMGNPDDENAIRASNSPGRLQRLQTAWKADTLTALVRIPSVDPKTGATVHLRWADTAAPLSAELCGQNSAFRRLHERALWVKRQIDWEASIGTEPSMRFNRLVNTPIRMSRNPANASAELRAYRSELSAIVKLHDGHTSPELSRVLRAWLGGGGGGGGV